MSTLPGVRIETARLLLRPPRLEDFEPLAAMSADPETMQFLGGPQPRPAAWRGFAGMAGSWALLGFGMFSMIEKATGRWLGRAGPIRPEGWPGTEVGWAVTREAQGRGFAYEAAVASMDYAVDVLGWTEIIHCIDDGNERSGALARRLGSAPLRRAVMPPPYENLELQVWGQSADAWRRRRGSLRT
jgi:RimJ/RimL family protein N-acetyltransferase